MSVTVATCSIGSSVAWSPSTLATTAWLSRKSTPLPAVQAGPDTSLFSAETADPTLPVATLLVDDIQRALDYFARHPTPVAMSAEEASGFHH